MPRKPRIESSDGLYHVLNRGNYRTDIFDSIGARDAFVRTLIEAAERFSWRVHSYCVMTNHYHLCLGTPIGNLSAGMRWLQATYALRFNGFRREHGHLFQGRFKSLVVEPDTHWCNLVDYIHLNPARAGLVPVDRLHAYRWSSLAEFPRIRRRSKCLDCTWMDHADHYSDTSNGWSQYRTHLQLKATDDPKVIRDLDRKMCRGWCIGDRDFKKALATETSTMNPALQLEGSALQEVNQLKWAWALESCLNRLNKRGNNIKGDRKSAEWKLAIATKLRQKTSVTNAWLADHLMMGTARSVSAICGQYDPTASPSWKRLKKLTFDH